MQFRIRTAPHDRFRREGNDLHTTVTITLVKLICGSYLFISGGGGVPLEGKHFFSLDYFLNFFIFQVQALVGFEKTLKHLDEHLVDMSSKVSMNMPFGSPLEMTQVSD